MYAKPFVYVHNKMDKVLVNRLILFTLFYSFLQSKKFGLIAQ